MSEQKPIQKHCCDCNVEISEYQKRCADCFIHLLKPKSKPYRSKISILIDVDTDLPKNELEYHLHDILIGNVRRGILSYYNIRAVIEN